ncbi:MAG: hypothetical protein ACERK0_13365 [Deltaproteobacteria bacterium]
MELSASRFAVVNILQLWMSLRSGESFMSISRYLCSMAGVVSDIIAPDFSQQIYHTQLLGPLSNVRPIEIGL